MDQTELNSLKITEKKKAAAQLRSEFNRLIVMQKCKRIWQGIDFERTSCLADLDDLADAIAEYSCARQLLCNNYGDLCAELITVEPEFSENVYDPNVMQEQFSIMSNAYAKHIENKWQDCPHLFALLDRLNGVSEKLTTLPAGKFSLSIEEDINCLRTAILEQMTKASK